MENIPQMKTIAQCAKITGLAEHYIRKLVWENKITYVTAGKKYLVNLDKFIEFLNNGMNVPQNEQRSF